MKLSISLLLFLIPFHAQAITFEIGPSARKILARNLEADQQDQLDDKAIFGSTNLKSDVSLSNQMVIATLDQAPIDFNQSLESIQAQLDAVRRNVDTTLPNNVRIAALNAYINNAVLMNKMGMLTDLEDESLINPTADSYIGERKVRKLAKSVRKNVGLQMKKTNRFFDTKSTVRAVRKAKVFSPKNRKLAKEQAAVEVKPAAVEDKPAVAEYKPTVIQNVQQDSKGKQERRLNQVQTWEARKPVTRRRPKKQQSYHVSPMQKLRANDELLELAKLGNLFKVDLSTIYKVTDDDLNRYMEHTDGTVKSAI